jgi:hypothetical protein
MSSKSTEWDELLKKFSEAGHMLALLVRISGNEVLIEAYDDCVKALSDCLHYMSSHK